MKKILLTGGCGYIGSHTAVCLLEAGYKVVIIDNLHNSKQEVLTGIEKITGLKPDFYNFDLSERDKALAFFEKNNDINAVVHFAALKAVGESVGEPLKYYRNNIVATLNLLEAMSRFRIANLVFSSSCTVYGVPDKLPVSEKDEIKKANNPYGNTKIICEDIIKDTVHSNSFLKAISLRYFNPIGAHHSAQIGELPLGEPENLVPYITQTAAGLRPKLKVFGNDYNTKDGSGVRDYIHVMDLAKAHAKALNRLEDKKQKEDYEVFNIGTGRGYSVLEIIKTFEKVSGKKLNYEIVSRRPGDIAEIYANSSLANQELGWQAEKDLSEMLASAWAWEKKLRIIL